MILILSCHHYTNKIPKIIVNKKKKRVNRDVNVTSKRQKPKSLLLCLRLPLPPLVYHTLMKLISIMFESFNKPLEVAEVQEVRMASIVENHAIENKK
jgi:hypothetical protein